MMPIILWYGLWWWRQRHFLQCSSTLRIILQSKCNVMWFIFYSYNNASKDAHFHTNNNQMPLLHHHYHTGILHSSPSPRVKPCYSALYLIFLRETPKTERGCFAHCSIEKQRGFNTPIIIRIVEKFSIKYNQKCISCLHILIINSVQYIYSSPPLPPHDKCCVKWEKRFKKKRIIHDFQLVAG